SSANRHRRSFRAPTARGAAQLYETVRQAELERVRGRPCRLEGYERHQSTWQQLDGGGVRGGRQHRARQVLATRQLLLRESDRTAVRPHHAVCAGEREYPRLRRMGAGRLRLHAPLELLPVLRSEEHTS